MCLLEFCNLRAISTEWYLNVERRCCIRPMNKNGDISHVTRDQAFASSTILHRAFPVVYSLVNLSSLSYPPKKNLSIIGKCVSVPVLNSVGNKVTFLPLYFIRERDLGSFWHWRMLCCMTVPFLFPT
jgi:hypothetical protein